MKNKEELEMAKKYAPRIFFDTREPFLPEFVGYTVVKNNNIKSPSFQRQLIAEENSFIIEYAIYWDWDIGHHYDLEHLWVKVNSKGEVTAFEGSAHGLYINLWPSPPKLETLVKALKNKDANHRYCSAAEASNLPEIYKSGEGLICYSQPGKHAFAPTGDWYRKQKQFVIKECTERSGHSALIGGVYGEQILNKYCDYQDLARKYLKEASFTPTLEFNNLVDLNKDVELIPWNKLYQLIPERIDYWMHRLKILYK
ncbi:hypothetical protein C8C77_10916 [Halanaerobium saccharolyticum]|uniref:Uncharacterized protein n=1 Tax=Halanaerobium saccharolyticum TaxID=43595 RepID=A0A4R7Z199_9FIRM|nr:hypothetical protein [Halanaerobium saccharolyticum]RAK07841.1 hypothetical protein C7958_11211 [Halanaerobium saccharolyticum]TDW04455.1 hypothetical protein C8C77_10916 [Halanaerobium saccharolyticum]TDX59791.1 hypothetical protein C7956_11216 [Halanaerobium saccharolyticum]